MNDIQEIDGINFSIDRLKLKHQAIIHNECERCFNLKCRLRSKSLGVLQRKFFRIEIFVVKITSNEILCAINV